jgi:aspartate/methionine/tyrosine aminotransferase
MNLRPFKLERYFAEYEFKVRFLLSASDCEGLAMAELLEMASPESLDLWRNLKLGYTETPGHTKLRFEIAALYRDLSPEHIMVAAPEEAIFLAFQTLLEPDDHVIAVAPAYQSLSEIARSKGCRVTSWPLEPAGDGWRLDLDRLEKAATPRTRMLVLNFPHNPTGAMISRADLDKIVAFARERGIFLFSDEMYRLLEWDRGLRLPPICDLYEKGISLSGLSKSMALPGLRIGWLAARDRDVVERCLVLRDYTTICNGAPGEILAIIALQNRERILDRNLGIIRGNIGLAENFFAERPAVFSWIGPRAGSVAFPRWLGPGTAEQFCQRLLDDAGIMIVPGTMFDYEGGHFRIGLGRTNFGEALARLGDFLRTRAGGDL